jgi:hypothetical protein
MRKDSYESILTAVGRMLDRAEARGFAIREADEGLHVEAFDAEGAPQYRFQLDLKDLVELLDWSTEQEPTPSYARATTADEGTLIHFIERHSRELVGTVR